MSHFIILTDAHHMPGEPETWANFQNLLKALKPGSTLISLGDFFDIWYRPLKEHANDYGELLDSIKEATQNDITMIFIGGNRDFLFTQGDAKKLGVQLKEEPFIFNLKDQSICLIHGDILLTEDVSYQAYRKKVRRPHLRLLARYGPRFYIDRRVEKIRNQSNQKKALLPIDQYPVDLKKAAEVIQSCDRLICGHTHIPQMAQLPQGSLQVLPAFGDKGEYLKFDGERWMLSCDSHNL